MRRIPSKVLKKYLQVIRDNIINLVHEMTNTMLYKPQIDEWL